MPERPRILYLIESRVGLRFDEKALSAPLQGRIVQLIRAERRIESLEEEVAGLSRRRRNYLLLLFGSLFVGALGFVLGALSLLREVVIGPGLGPGLLAVLGALGIFDVDYHVLVAERRLRLESQFVLTEIARLSVAFDAEVETVARAVAVEVPEPRPLD